MLERAILALVIAAGCRFEEAAAPHEESVAAASAVVGVRCREGGRELHLVMSSSSACSVHRALARGEKPDAIDVALSGGEALWCRAGDCRAIDVELDLRSFHDRYGATGRWSASVDGEPLEGVFDAGWCGPPSPGGADVSIEAMSLNQGVERPLVEPSETPIVAGRPGILSLELSGTATVARAITAQVEIQSEGSDPITVRAEATVSERGSLSVGPIVLGPRTTWSISLSDAESCAAPGAPVEGAVEASPSTGPLRVVLVPIRYFGTIPDTSDSTLVEVEKQVLARYPIESLELSVREPIDWTVSLDDLVGDPWDLLVGALVALRANDGAPANVFYYGIVAPAECSTCPGGVAAAVVQPNDTVMLAAVGLATNFVEFSEIMMHELGHLLGRAHAPCGDPDGIDTRYPYENGTIGVRGWSSLTNEFIPPDYYDMMGYCGPNWISDYTYRALRERITRVNARSDLTAPIASRWLFALQTDARARWLDPIDLRDAPRSPIVALELVGIEGTVEAHAYRIADGGALLWLIEPPPPGARGVKLPGGRTLSLDR